VEFDLCIKEFVVMNIDKTNYNIKLNILYRSDYFTFFLIEKGTIRFKLDNASYQVYEGDVVFCPMAETFWVEEISDDYNTKYIFFPVKYISEAGFNYKSAYDLIREPFNVKN